MRHTISFVYGLFFAVLQYFYFLTLEGGLSATMMTYMTMVFGWLAGTWVGLNWKRSTPGPYHVLVSLGAYFAVTLCVSQFPFDQRFLPLYTVCVGISGASVGIFYRSFVRHFREAKDLFFAENNGFVVGFLAALIGFLGFGRNFLLAAPPALAAGLLVLHWVMETHQSQVRPVTSQMVPSTVRRKPFSGGNRLNFYRR